MYDSADNETSFSEAYRSQILNPESDSDDESSRSTLIIIILIVVALALGIFGYMYLSKNNQTQAEKKVDSVVAEPTESNSNEKIQESPPESTMLNNIDELLLEEGDNTAETESESESESIKIGKETQKVDKIKKIQVKSLSKQKGEDTYLEQLAELSKEIDGEEK